MKNLNLCTDSWLPVRMCSGACVRVSLEEFFAQAHEISDLILAAHERISIMRLLICIAQRAINGPEDREEWEDCKEDIVPKALEYLQQWRTAFNLLGEDGAFLQPSNVEHRKPEDWGALSKISLSSAEGNTSALFDNAAGTERFVPLSQIAVDLITFQNFAPPGTIGVTNWSGVQTGVKSPDSAPGSPCVPESAIHLFICGENLLDTLWYNLRTREEIKELRNGMGVPIWELMPLRMEHEEAVQNATTTYLGRLVPLSRVVKISMSADKCLVSKGIHYPVYRDKELMYYESTMSIKVSEDKEQRITRQIVGANIDRAMWRNLPALLHWFSAKKVKPFARPDVQDLPSHFGIWVGALVLDQAKILGTMEDYYEHLDRKYVGVSADKQQAVLMGMADSGVEAVKNALSVYYKCFNTQFENKKSVFACAEKNYWSWLTLKKHVYISCLGIAESDSADRRTVWAKIIRQAACKTFDLLVSRNNTRQLAAWARARRVLPSITKILKHNDK